MESPQHDPRLDGPEGLAERRRYLEEWILDELLPNLEPDIRIRASNRAHQRRIDSVRTLKAEDGHPEWALQPGQPIDESDPLVAAFLGSSTWHLFLADSIVQELLAVPLAEETVLLLENRLGVDARGALRRRIDAGGSWMAPAALWDQLRPPSTSPRTSNEPPTTPNASELENRREAPPNPD